MSWRSVVTEQRTVCVLGMHRSGTSLVARLLNLLGVDLGPESHMLKPRADNPLGFWEHEGFVEVNERILRALGGSWDRPPHPPPGWERSPLVSDFLGEGRDIVERDFIRSELWGWKDPRTCLTLPLWRQVIPRMRYMLCFRNPLDVARSLERRDGLPIEAGGRLWLHYVETSLRHTAGERRLLLFYEDVLAHWAPELGRLAAFIGEREAGASEHVQTAVRDALRRELRHHRASTEEVLSEADLPVEAVAQHLVLRAHVGILRAVPGEVEEVAGPLRVLAADRAGAAAVEGALRALGGEAAVEVRDRTGVPAGRRALMGRFLARSR